MSNTYVDVCQLIGPTYLEDHVFDRSTLLWLQHFRFDFCLVLQCDVLDMDYSEMSLRRHSLKEKHIYYNKY